MKYDVSFSIDLKRNTCPGKFIAIEGIDGSGKTTQVEEIKKYFEKIGREFIISQNPTDGVIGKFIREVLVGKIQLPKEAFQYLFCADRASEQKKLIEILTDGKTVLMDRYFWSSVAYGILDKKINIGEKDVRDGNSLLVAYGILAEYNQFIAPDLTFYLNVSPNVALSRIEKERKNLDIYDKLEKLEKISKGYKFLLEKFPKEFTVIDGEKPIEEITNQIISKLEIRIS
ncbi:MAG: dTMP kinase [Patescibacteria group bacterium]|nr:dTMP kinase [Patescibacteria group bacterium]